MRQERSGYWLEEAGHGPSCPPLRDEARAEAVVIGGGFAGLWAAWHLRRRHPEGRVILLESNACGHGPSGRNAGFATAPWHRLEGLIESFGEPAALEVCERAAASVDEIGAWAVERGVDAWFRKGGHLKVATSAAQDERWEASVRACARLGRPAEYTAVPREEVRRHCASPIFRAGAMMPASATVQPARLALGLRSALIEEGVTIHERTRARRLIGGPDGVAVETEGGARVLAESAVIAINSATSGLGPLANRLAVSSSHMLITEPVPEVLEELGWVGGECISTARTYLHYMRTTPDGRIAFGYGGGRIAYGARLGGKVDHDPRLARSLANDLVRFFPQLRGRRIRSSWGGPVDISPNHFPVVGTMPDGRTHYVFGFTGNGVSLAHLTGNALASLVLDERDAYSRLPLVEPASSRVPPEPIRWIGGNAVRSALLRKEQREDAGLAPGALSELIVDLPRRFGIHIGR